MGQAHLFSGRLGDLAALDALDAFHIVRGEVTIAGLHFRLMPQTLTQHSTVPPPVLPHLLRQNFITLFETQVGEQLD